MVGEAGYRFFCGDRIKFFIFLKNSALMKTVNIAHDEYTIYETFKEGHPVQVRISIAPGEEKDYDKGKLVKVVYDETETEGKIVSQPLEIDSSTEKGKKTISVVVEKP
jgi:hypothetical protein